MSNNILNITINTSNKCNLTCDYCLTKYGIETLNIFNDIKYEINVNILDNLIFSLIELNKILNGIKIYISIVGGEPLLHKSKIIYLFKQFKKYNFLNIQKIEIITNLLLLDKEFLNNIIMYNINIFFRCSAHFLSSYASKDSKNKFIINIMLLNKYNIDFQISIILSEYLIKFNIIDTILFLNKGYAMKIEFLLDTYNKHTINAVYIKNFIILFKYIIYLIKNNLINFKTFSKAFQSYLTNINVQPSCDYNFKDNFLSLNITPDGKTFSCGLVYHVKNKIILNKIFLFDFSFGFVYFKKYKNKFDLIANDVSNISCPSKNGKYNILFYDRILRKILFNSGL